MTEFNALHRSSGQRLVLFPHGQPVADEHYSRCWEYVMRCGGDVARAIDAPITTIEQFTGYIERIRGIRMGTEPALVVFTRTNPLALTVVNARRKMERALPTLRYVPWIIYYAANEDPFFVTTANELGAFVGDLSHACVWLAPDSQRYLVLPSTIEDLSTITARLAEFEADELERTGERVISRR